jgi:Mn2+/Fe2+ NRAMP family transporter
MSQKQFDIAKWTFFLVAFVICAHVVAALAAEAACLLYAQEIIDGKAKCDASGKLMEIMGAALAAALAFAGGKSLPPPQPPKDEP